MTLFIVQDDAQWIAVKRDGRFSIARDAALSEPHLLAAVSVMQERMIAGLQKLGYQYLDTGENGFELEGPLPHYEFSSNADVDPGPAAQPDPRDTDRFEAWERAEKARVARKMGQESDFVDFMLKATFKRRVPTKFHYR